MFAIARIWVEGLLNFQLCSNFIAVLSPKRKNTKQKAIYHADNALVLFGASQSLCLHDYVLENCIVFSIPPLASRRLDLQLVLRQMNEIY